MSLYPEIKQSTISKNYNCYNFFKEISNEPKIFQTLKNKYSDENLLESNFISKKSIISNYPLKSSLEDFYRSNSFTKNSMVMAQCSQEKRRDANNFKK